MKRAAILAAMLGGCATSYESATSARQLGPGMWSVSAHGNGFTSRSTVVEYTYTKAAEVCGGAGFDVLDADRGTRRSVVTFDNGQSYQEVQKHNGTLLIQCRQPQQPVHVDGPPGR